MAERITCPVCGYDKAVHYDYDQGGPGKAQRTGIYMGYCAQCRRLRGTSGNMRVRVQGDEWIAVWIAPDPGRPRTDQCMWCDAFLVAQNKSGYCKRCRPECEARRVAFAQCGYRNCRAWFCYRPQGKRAVSENRKFCNQTCNRREWARLAREENPNKRPRRNIKPNKRIEVAYRYGYRCARCKKLLNLNAPPKASNAMEIDHIIELANGGSDELDNLRPLCARCHRDRQQNDAVQLNIV